MQKVAAYLLERRDGLQSSEARKAEGKKICKAIETWLKAKGATGDDDGGSYTSEDGSKAEWCVDRSQDGDRCWTRYRLDETTEGGRRFSASLSVTVGAKTVVLYVTLEVGSVATQVNPIQVDPRCPKVVRDLLELPGAWYHRESRLRRLTHIRGFDEGERLALEIKHADRTVPYVVVSTVSGHSALERLDDRLAYDLAGLANVFTVDEAASWALTDMLRKPLSCYSGAVRVYWPQLQPNTPPYRHPLWTASRLLSLDPDVRAGRDRFRRQMRRLIMRASAVSVVRPREIDEIRNAATQAEFSRMKAKAKSLADFEKLADSYAKDNDELRSELVRKEEEISHLQSRLAQLESENTSLKFHLHQGKPDAGYDKGGKDNVEPDVVQDDDAATEPPQSGEIRFYKKIYSAPGRDVMVHIGDCNHNAWQSAAKADKAKKGIAKLEGRNDWRSIQHCAKCTGGGMWRVRW
ncbi:MAG: hypothetical protein D6815_13020 [Candidatus Dadabacteria bacterium]|nr:MAG: hypothetical protein D6815_13020 [Candidatus Dadabacteria bacterium]